MATGGSTNLIIHLIAIARRANINLKLMDFEEISNETPVLVNVKPHGTESVGTGFHNAGGVASLMKEMEEKRRPNRAYKKRIVKVNGLYG